MTNLSALTTGFNLRAAIPADAEAIRYVHVASLWGIGLSAYGPAVIDSIVRHYPTVDMALIAGGTYYVIEQCGEIAACAGWIRAGTQDGKQPGVILDRNGQPARPAVPRDSMLVRAMFVHPKWTRRGFGRRLLEYVEHQGQQVGCGCSTLFATLTGVPLYEAAGYRAVARWDVRLADNAIFAAVQMQKELRMRAAA